jgi:hypothetical protein
LGCTFGLQPVQLYVAGVAASHTSHFIIIYLIIITTILLQQA